MIVSAIESDSECYIVSAIVSAIVSDSECYSE